ncbi:hypothetical protein C8J56DRAFT_1130983 [Mycena floridula]|nr:hypothetical protein C8J56DRAFT_1130983 [Mycena floridula]
MEALRFTLHLNTHDQHAHHTPGTLLALQIVSRFYFSYPGTCGRGRYRRFCATPTGPHASNTTLVSLDGPPFEVDRSDSVTAGTHTMGVINTAGSYLLGVGPTGTPITLQNLMKVIYFQVSSEPATSRVASLVNSSLLPSRTGGVNTGDLGSTSTSGVSSESTASLSVNGTPPGSPTHNTPPNARNSAPIIGGSLASIFFVAGVLIYVILRRRLRRAKIQTESVQIPTPFHLTTLTQHMREFKLEAESRPSAAPQVIHESQDPAEPAIVPNVDVDTGPANQPQTVVVYVPVEEYERLRGENERLRDQLHSTSEPPPAYPGGTSRRG